MLDRVAFLKANTLLADVPTDIASTLAERMREVRLPAGDAIFRDGDPGDAAYFVVDGSLRIEKDGIRLVQMTTGDCVGEFALIDEGPRSASAIAETDVILLEWRHADFEKALTLSGSTAKGIFQYLIGKLRRDVSLRVNAGLERERWQHDLKRAHEIQMAMLPQGDLVTDQVEISGYCQPAADVGGDYHDYVEIGDTTGVMIADVTGHGFYAGLLVAMAKSCLHTQAKIDASPSAVMAAMNWTVLHSVQSGLFMSGCYVRLDPKTRSLSYSNAGHPYPFVYHQATGVIDRLESTDVMLGVPGLEDTKFSMGTRPWEPGDVLVLYSDGIHEAISADEEEFGEERLERLLREAHGDRASGVRTRILDAVAEHTRGIAANDDVTVVVAKAR
jgi:serine phosphatase RsbU (regulator of sigma subunit)